MTQVRVDAEERIRLIRRVRTLRGLYLWLPDGPARQDVLLLSWAAVRLFRGDLPISEPDTRAIRGMNYRIYYAAGDAAAVKELLTIVRAVGAVKIMPRMRRKE